MARLLSRPSAFAAGARSPAPSLLARSPALLPLRPARALAPPARPPLVATAPRTRVRTAFREGGSDPHGSGGGPRSGGASPPQQPGAGSRASAGGAEGKARAGVTVGIDFGTYASGFAYARNEGGDGGVGGPAADGRVRLFSSWPDAPAKDAKTLTAILYKGSSVDSIGWTAWKRWSCMGEGERAGQTYLDSFKLLLAPGGGGGVGGAGSSHVAPTLPPGMTATQVVADFLTRLQEFVVSHLSRDAPLDPADIGWCLTVPAMWDEEAKAKMRRAAGRAGMFRPSDPSSFTLTLEPEAAALAAAARETRKHELATRVGDTFAALTSSRRAWATRVAGTIAVLTRADAVARTPLRDVSKERSTKGRATALSDGDVLLVLDCGGGTVDVTLHRVKGRGHRMRLEEVAPGKGVLAGGRYVDEAAWGLVRGLVGPGAWDAWRREQPGEWVALANRWELAKREKGPVELQLPAALMAGAIAAGGKLPRTSHSDAVLLTPDGLLVIVEEAMKWSVLGPQVDRALAAAREVLEEGQAEGYRCTKVLLTGGLANSAFLQRRARQLAAERGAALLMPQVPAAAVVTGAVVYGQSPAAVSSRCCRFTYGVGMAIPWTPKHEAAARLEGYPRKVWNNADDRHYAEGVFNTFVTRGQLVEAEQVVAHTFYPFSMSNGGIAVKVYASESKDVEYVNEPGVRLLATVAMELPSGWSAGLRDRHENPLEVEFRFGSTEITVVARDVRSNNSVATSVAWAAAEVEWV
ncbi:hypothetical protein HYH03_001777 [Edaphochlamys debaryana]|uniref:Uncharacterized protein n=1 Tax=Edaphochlamys debaryana TaxID=47281 RepID=A0A835YEI2_9CHLO|nr:hypothetical protein HYH03_001777 [Edaphochlamys debaryana]|eukprot:KAG2500197.1 hypothetical protein HYH03_001777 [Edaphochlamys debaryana]